MFEKIIKKLAAKLIDDAYREGWGDGYEAGCKIGSVKLNRSHKPNKGQFQKGYTPWNKGMKKNAKS